MRERQEAFRDARLIVIASEGKDTERIYFKALAKEYTNPRVHVHILERSEAEQNNSSPEHVLKQLNDYNATNEQLKSIRGFDLLEVWTVFGGF